MSNVPEYTEKKGSFRRNVLVTFLLITMLSLGATGVVSLSFFNMIGNFTTSESAAALELQIKQNIEQTAQKNALVIQQKLQSAESFIKSLAEECEGLFSNENTFQPRKVYYDYFFDNPLEGPAPSDLQWDAWRNVWLSWNYSSWYVPGSNSINYLSYETQYNDTLHRISNLDYMFRYVHTQAPEFRWLYVAFRNDIFINYPGSIVGGSNSDRNDPTRQFKASQEEWYQSIFAGYGSIVYDGPYYDPIDGVLLLSIGRTIYHENGTALGIIAGDITVADIRSKILDVHILETGRAALITSDGGVVAHHEVDDKVYAFYEPDLPPLAAFEPVTSTDLTKITAGTSGTLEYTKNNVDMLLAYAPVGIGGYICIVTVPKEEALAAIPVLQNRNAAANTEATMFILAVTIGGIILAGAVAITVTNQITRPLQYLMDLAMRNVEAMIRKEDLSSSELQVDESFTSQDDEIGELARAFQGMLETIREDEE